MHSNEAVSLPIYNALPSAGALYFRRNKPENSRKSHESDLLRSIRAAFQGSGKEPNPAFRSTVAPSVDDYTAEEELTWNEHTVIWSIGGVLKRKWCFEEEGQPVQYACFGWLRLEGTVQSGGSGSAARYTSNDDSSLSQDQSEKDTFSPFFRARKARLRKVEPPSRERGIYIFLRNIGKVFLTNGLDFTFSLPFIVKQAWQLNPHGVLLQRVLDPMELEEDEPLPTLYTMTNIFQEPRPIGRTEGIKGAYNRKTPTISPNELDGSMPLRSVPAEDQVLWVSTHYPGQQDDLIVTISSDKRRISIWRYVFIKPADVPTSSPIEPSQSSAKLASRRGASMSVGMGDKDLLARNDRIRDFSPDFESTQPVEFAEMPPLSSLPGMPPELSTTATLASLGTGGSMGSQWGSSILPHRRNSLTRNDLSSTMDRMVLGRRSEVYGSYTVSALSASLQPVFWFERMLEIEELSEKDCSAWRKFSFAVFDRRYDGKRTGSLLGICLPASERLLLYDIVYQQQHETLEITQRTETPAISIAPVIATRPNIWDLLILRPDHSLAIMTYNLFTIPIDPRLDSLEAGEVSNVLDVSMADASLEGDLSMASVIDRMKIVALRDSIWSSITLVFEDGSKSILSLDLNPTDTLAENILQIISVYLLPEEFFRIHTRFLQLWTKEEKSDSSDIQFDCIAEAILNSVDMTWKESKPSRSSVWQSLASSSSHFRLYDDTALLDLDLHSPYAKHPPIQPISPSIKLQMSAVITALHVLAEELRLTAHMHQALSKLAVLHARICRVARPGWADYAKRLFPYSAEGWVSGIEVHGKSDIVLPLDFGSALYSHVFQPEVDYKLLEMIATRRPSCFAFGKLEKHPVLRDLSNLMGTLFEYKQKDLKKKAENAVLQMVQRHFSPDWLNLLPLAISMPFREAMRTCQIGPPSDWPLTAYEFVGRNDITTTPKVTGELMFNDGYRSVKDHLKSNIPRKTYRMLFEEVHKAVHHTDEAITGVELDLQDFTEIRFGQDRRLQEVARMLRSSNIPSIRMVERQELNEHELAKEQQNQMIRTAERTLALPLGRAMFTFGSVPTVTREVYNVPKIELAIRLQPYNVVISPEPGKIAPEALQWAEFHNGAAAALRISPASDAIDSSWISFNRPTDLTAEHAGFLYGLGLTGHLKEMLTWHTFGYLTPKHDLTSIGVLLGLSAANVGSQNKHVTKLLAVHTPALLPSPDVDLNVPLMTQAAGLVGIGLLYMGSKNRRMAEVALHQMSRPDLLQPHPGNENREAYTNAAALSFGMIMLGRGTVTTSPADVALLSRLRVLIHGEKTSAFQTVPGKSTFDVNLTSPAATVALGLMYLRTGRQDIADILTIPDSIMALERIQPNFLLVRTLARAMIMWNDIQPTKDWVHLQIPVGIFRVMEQTLRQRFVHDAVELAYYHIVSACCFAIALKYAGTAREEAYVRIIDYYDFFVRTINAPMQGFDDKIRRAAVRDGLSLISLSLSMVMAGTGEINCLRRFRLAHGMNNMPIRYGAHMATHMALGLLFLGGGRFTLGNSNAAIACMVAAFFPHFPPLSNDNRAYLPALRHLWVLAVEPRCLVARDVDTKEVVYLPMKIRVKDDQGLSGTQLISPTLIPGLDRLLTIKIDTPRYWPFLIDVAKNKRHQEALLRSQTIFVKRRTMFLSYLEDPKGSRSLFTRSGLSTGDAASLDFPQYTDTTVHPASDLQHFITSHSNDISFIAFADRFCRADGVTKEENIFNAFCHAALYDCLVQDKPHILSSYLALYRARVMSPRSRFFHIVHHDLIRISEFYLKQFDRRFMGRTEVGIRPALLRETAVASTAHALDAKLDARRQLPEFQKALRAYIFNQLDSPDLRNSEQHPDVERDLSWYLGCNALPYAPYFPILHEFAREMVAKHTSQAPPGGIMGTGKDAILEEGIKIIIHSAGAGIYRPIGYWTIESFEDVLKIWKLQ